MISRNSLTIPFYLPRICRLFKNWPLYMFNYLSRRIKPASYYLRNGIQLVDATGTLAGTIAVVFIRREYGALASYKTIVDIGANMGCFTIYAAQMCPEARICSYEPEENNFRVLSQNITVNSLQSRVTAHRYAIAGSSGQRSITIDASPLHTLLTTPEGGGLRQTVSCTTIREILAEQRFEVIDFMKMNCEGAEYEILENCSPADFARITNLRIEYHNFDKERRNGNSLVRLLRENGYSIERFTTYREHDGIFTESGFIWATRNRV